MEATTAIRMERRVLQEMTSYLSLTSDFHRQGEASNLLSKTFQTIEHFHCLRPLAWLLPPANFDEVPQGIRHR